VGDSVGTRGRRTFSAGDRLEDAVEHGGAIEPAHDGQPTTDRGGLEATHLLHPPHVPLQVLPLDVQGIQVMLDAPGEKHAKIGLGMRS
jgi:hypothetical protein